MTEPLNARQKLRANLGLDHEYRRPDGTRRGAKAVSIEDAQDALGIDWMTDWDDLTDAIPPAMTQFIGEQLRAYIESESAA